MIDGVPRHIWNRWTTFWWMLRHPGDPRQLEDLARRYSEPHRTYHTLEHITHCLRELDTVRDDLDFAQLMLVEAALWFHDAVYDPHAEDNEVRSAQLAATVLAATEDPNIGETVGNLIRLSDHRRGYEGEGHEPLIDVGHTRLPVATFLDIDLAILGQDRAMYDVYAAGIRHEYQHVPDDAFRLGRAAFLERFLERKHIYGTEHFHEKYEERARANLSREIAKLRAGGGT